ncbi:hypothetical protein S40293_11147 [Stachybotrys chartarum IBT 40293]|nr:hypothetical protein S40293_11147 [Stachybotrys chartarum IBT 40293]
MADFIEDLPEEEFAEVAPADDMPGWLVLPGISRRAFDGETKAWVLIEQLYPTEAQKNNMQPGGKWWAILHVVAKDLPRLMREGFFWGEANIKPEEGYVLDQGSLNTSDDGNDQDYQYTRCYHLSDLDQSPQWFAKIELFTEDIRTLAHFSVHDLSVANIIEATAYNGQDREVYHSETEEPLNNFNAIYNTLYLKGWWLQVVGKGTDNANDSWVETAKALEGLF